MFSAPSSPAARRDRLDNFLSADDVIPYRPMGEKEWKRLRSRGFFDLMRRFVGWSDLRLKQGLFSDLAGFGWSGIYRSMRVPAIAAASFKNEGHFRAKGRVSGTENFFAAAFRYPRKSPALQQVVRLVNLRHHVAGVAGREGDTVEVMPHYETAYVYVATAFIESIRRGYQARGILPGSPEEHRLAADLCTMLYQIAGMVGLTRVPKDLAAHDKFRDNYEAYLRTMPRSKWMEKQAQELAKRIFPYTAAMAGNSLEDHLHRYLDPETAAYLFPDPAVLGELRPVYDDLVAWFAERRKGYIWKTLKHLFVRPPPPDVMADLEPLWEAYREAPDDSVAARLIGAVLLHAIDARAAGARWHIPLTMDLKADEPIIRQGQPPEFCYVLLKMSAPLVVTRVQDGGEGPGEEIAQIGGPTVIGEIGMWRGTPAIATVSCRHDCRIKALRLDRHAFASLKSYPGFWTAAASEVQRRLRISMRGLEESLGQHEGRSADPRLTPVLLLLRYVNGDNTVNLDLVPGVYPETSLAECVDLLRQMASGLRDQEDSDAGLRGALENLLQVIG